MLLNELNYTGTSVWALLLSEMGTQAEGASRGLSDRPVFPESDVRENLLCRPGSSLGESMLRTCPEVALGSRFLTPIQTKCSSIRRNVFLGLWPNPKEPVPGPSSDS